MLNIEGRMTVTKSCSKAKSSRRVLIFPIKYNLFNIQIGSEGDNPSCAFVDQHEVQHNDVFVIGTDGLFDNLAANQIKIILDEEAKENKQFDCATAAKTIASYAFKLSLDPNYQSPFAKSARQNGMHFKGGKSDDITVIVAQVVEAKKV